MVIAFGQDKNAASGIAATAAQKSGILYSVKFLPQPSEPGA